MVNDYLKQEKATKVTVFQLLKTVAEELPKSNVKQLFNYLKRFWRSEHETKLRAATKSPTAKTASEYEIKATMQTQEKESYQNTDIGFGQVQAKPKAKKGIRDDLKVESYEAAKVGFESNLSDKQISQMTGIHRPTIYHYRLKFESSLKS